VLDTHKQRKEDTSPSTNNLRQRKIKYHVLPVGVAMGAGGSGMHDIYFLGAHGLGIHEVLSS